MLLSVDKDKTFSELKDLNTAKFDIKISQYNKYLKRNIKKAHFVYFKVFVYKLKYLYYKYISHNYTKILKYKTKY